MTNNQKGFTLIELLIVVAIVAILAVVVVLTLNPAQLLRQSRDSTRISDMSTIKGALSLYLADVTSPSLATSSSNCYEHTSSTQTLCTGGSRFTAGTLITSTLTNTTGTGWMPVNFGSISSGSPLAVEPLDPVNNATYFYAYKADTTNQTFEINAKMESTKYSNGGASDVEGTDGGNVNTLYEVGTAPGLAL